jgi:hypothetical protein
MDALVNSFDGVCFYMLLSPFCLCISTTILRTIRGFTSHITMSARKLRSHTALELKQASALRQQSNSVSELELEPVPVPEPIDNSSSEEGNPVRSINLEIQCGVPTGPPCPNFIDRKVCKDHNTLKQNIMIWLLGPDSSFDSLLAAYWKGQPGKLDCKRIQILL